VTFEWLNLTNLTHLTLPRLILPESLFPLKYQALWHSRYLQSSESFGNIYQTHKVPRYPAKENPANLQGLTLQQSNMCICLWIEYCCECNKPDCPHKNPSHPHHHVQDKLWQLDHNAWRFCPAFIQVLDSVRHELEDANPEENNRSLQQEEDAAITRPSRCFKDSTDPRHNGYLPLCQDIRYRAWRIAKDCEYCRDYWIGRSMENAV